MKLLRQLITAIYSKTIEAIEQYRKCTDRWIKQKIDYLPIDEFEALIEREND